jgi:hypothetical protein
LAADNVNLPVPEPAKVIDFDAPLIMELMVIPPELSI